MRPISLVMLFLSVALLAALPLTAAHITHTASTTDDLTGLAMVSSNNGWAVGKTGTSLHYDGSSWSLIPSGTTADLFGVSFGPPSAPSADSGFAVGGSGGTAVALYRSGVSWTPAMAGLTGPDAKQLSSVSALSPSDAWAVDAVSGAFWHWSGVAGLGGGWGEVTATGFGLNSIFMTSSFDGWAVGAGGRIYHYTGGGWNLFTTAGFSLNSVFMVNQNEGWAVGDNGAIFHYSSGTWTGPVSPGSTNQNLRSVFMISETEGWAVGDGDADALPERLLDAGNEYVGDKPEPEHGILLRGYWLRGRRCWGNCPIERSVASRCARSNPQVGLSLKQWRRVDCWMLDRWMWHE